MARQWRQWEGGFSTSVQGMFYLVLLWMLFGFVYDLGNAAFVSVRLRSAVFAAAQDGAKLVDVGLFMREQRLQFSGDAVPRAQAVLDTQLSGLTVLEQAVNPIQTADNYLLMAVSARVTVPMRVLGSFGLPPIELSASAQAEAISGATSEHE